MQCFICIFIYLSKEFSKKKKKKKNASEQYYCSLGPKVILFCYH